MLQYTFVARCYIAAIQLISGELTAVGLCHYGALSSKKMIHESRLSDLTMKTQVDGNPRNES